MGIDADSRAAFLSRLPHRCAHDVRTDDVERMRSGRAFIAAARLVMA